jgi:Holliday junction DNA helicase RuvB
VNDRVTVPERLEGEVEFDRTLRPRTFDEFIGQSKLKENLKVFIEAAKQRGESLDHILFYGPPGLGKTTLAHIVAREMGVDIKTSTGPVLERPVDLAGMLTKLEHKDVLFIDEVHRMNRTVEEYLYPAMEDFALDMVLDKGAGARSLRLPLERFTLVGATTRAGLLTSPFRSRFGVISRLGFYPPGDLYKIVIRSAGILGAEIDEPGALAIASRARGTPRVANRLLRRVRDFAQVKHEGRIDRDIAVGAMESLGVDEAGFDEMDKRIIKTIIEKFSGGPVGIDTISVAVGEEPDTIEEVFEPYLILQGYLKRTPRGREATDLAYKHFGIKKEEQKGLFSK